MSIRKSIEFREGFTVRKSDAGRVNTTDKIKSEVMETVREALRDMGKDVKQSSFTCREDGGSY